MAKRKSKQQKNKTLSHSQTKTPQSLTYFPVQALIFLLFVVAMVFAPPNMGLLTGHHLLLKSYSSSLMVGVLFLWWLWQQRRQTQVSHQVNLSKYWLLALWLLGGLSLLWSVNIDFTLHKWLLWTTTVMVFYLSLRLDKTIIVLNKFAWAIFLIGVILSLIGILQYFLLLGFIDQSVTPAATFSNKNFATHPIILILPIGLYLLISSRQSIAYWLACLGIAVMMLFIFYTQTRAAWLSMLIQIILGLVYVLIIARHIKSGKHWQTGKWWALMTSVCLLLIMFNIAKDGHWQPFWQVVTDKVAISTQAGGDSGRFDIWALGVQMFLDKPFLGSGLGSFFDNMANGGYASFNTKGTQKVHNSLLELAIDLGSIGLVLLFGFVVSLMLSFSRMVKFCVNRWQVEQVFYAMLVLALIGSGVNLLFSSVYQHSYPLLLLAIYSAILLSHSSQILGAKTVVKTIAPWWTYGVMLLSACLLLTQIMLYQSVVNTYNKTTNYIIKVAKGNVLPISLTPWINTPDFSTSRRSFLEGLFNGGQYQATIYLAEDILSRWPSNHTALFRASVAKFYLKDYSGAHRYSERLKKVSPQGDYRGFTNQMVIYAQQGKATEVWQLFNELAKKPETLLAKREDSYRYLLIFALQLNQPEPIILSFYQKYNQYHPRNLDLETKMATYYLSLKQVKKAVPMMKNALMLNANIPKFSKILKQIK